MEITKENILKIEKFVSSKLDSLNWYHTNEMRPIARKLASLEKADKDIVEVAVLFHDVAKNKKLEGHNQRGADVARKFLEKEGYEQRFVEEVVYCIIAHSLPWNNQSNLVNTPEAKVVFDADMIQQISKFGVIKQVDYFNDLLLKDFKQGLIESRDMIFKAYNLLITKNGRKMAEPGYKFVKDFYKELL